MTQDSEANVAKPSTIFKAIVYCFAAFYLTGTVLWLWPPSKLRDDLVKPFTPVWRFVGWEQYWGVFGPRLRQLNYHTTATVTFADGSTRLFELPRMEKMTLLEKFQKEKWRKFGNDNMSWPDNRAFWPDLARWVARQCLSLDNPPVQVALNLHFVTIASPATFVSQGQLPEHTNCSATYIYRVKKKDLEP